ncbi:MAG: SRPBCC family protein [Myxococcota bacterium]
MKVTPLEITTPSEREICIVRSFAAPRALVYSAFTQPELVRRWLFGPDGWSFEVCDIDLRVGGNYRYLWRRESDGKRMGAGGTFREIVPPLRVVSSERFDDPWYPGESINTLEFHELGPKLTRLVQTLLYESESARDTVVRSPMEKGLSAGYARLDPILAQLSTTPTSETP